MEPSAQLVVSSYRYLKQKMKKSLTILVAVFFLFSVTEVAEAARPRLNISGARDESVTIDGSAYISGSINIRGDMEIDPDDRDSFWGLQYSIWTDADLQNDFTILRKNESGAYSTLKFHPVESDNPDHFHYGDGKHYISAGRFMISEQSRNNYELPFEYVFIPKKAGNYEFQFKAKASQQGCVKFYCDESAENERFFTIKVSDDSRERSDNSRVEPSNDRERPDSNREREDLLIKMTELRRMIIAFFKQLVSQL